MEKFSLEHISYFKHIADIIQRIDPNLIFQGFKHNSDFFLKIFRTGTEGSFPVKFLAEVYIIVQKLEESELKVSVFSYNGEEIEFSSFPTDIDTLEKVISFHIVTRLNSYKMCQGILQSDATLLENILIEKYGHKIYYRSTDCLRLIMGVNTCTKCEEVRNQNDLSGIKAEAKNIFQSQNLSKHDDDFMLQSVKVEDDDIGDIDFDSYDNRSLEEKPKGDDVLESNSKVEHEYMTLDKKPCTEDIEERQCKYCNMVFSTKSNLKVHVQRTHEAISVTCHICGKVSKSELSLKRHIKNVHGNKNQSIEKRKCSYCNKVFSDDKNLSKHIHNIHENNEVSCHFCGKTFKSKYYLTEHIKKVHGENKRFQCEFPGCTVAVKSKHHLMDHVAAVHENMARYTCSVCGKRHKYQSAQIKCENTHKGKFLYECGLCDKKFQYKESYDIHTRSHTGEKPFMCPICNLKMSMAKKIKEHIKKVHKITWQEAELQTNTKISEMIS